MNMKLFYALPFSIGFLSGAAIGMLVLQHPHRSIVGINIPSPYLRIQSPDGEFRLIPDKDSADRLQKMNWQIPKITNITFISQ